ncbi:MAG TPA: CDP-glycerol glycerophosphotransferase family protein [Actinocrinis sp.]|nr:CDP-glycerol glycerophosphotransferase family protein [Actinocrinis sp.]
MSASSTTPELSVVVIVYNDAAELPAAVNSVLKQTLRNVEVIIVDDHSTDATQKVGEGFAAKDPRVKYVRLPENSGGCSRPRNTGIEHATGTYVMFLDSNDTLNQHACMNMLAAIEDSGADVASGICIRRHHNRSGIINDVAWWPEFYAEPRVLDSLSELPDLLRDTLSTNKCYRRQFLLDHKLRFPEGYHYEDLLFSAKAYLSAKRIALIPDTVYYWNVIVRAAQKSISNRRNEITNLRDRIGIHRMIDQELAQYERDGGDPAVRLAKDAKFVGHDLPLYLRDLPFQDQDYIAECVALFRDYIATLDPAVFTNCEHKVAVVGAYLLMVGDVATADGPGSDWAGVVAVAENLIERERVTADLVEQDGQVYWTGAYLDTELGRAALNVTELGWQLAEFDRANLTARLTGLEPLGGGRVRISGETLNLFGRVPADAELSGRLDFRPRTRALRKYNVKASSVRHEGDRLVWSADVNLTKTVKPVGLIDQVWEVTCRITAKEAGTGKSLGTAAAKVTATRLPGQATGADQGPDQAAAAAAAKPTAAAKPVTVTAKPLLTRAAGDRWTAGIDHRGRFVFTLTAHNRLAKTITAPLERGGEGGGGVRLLRMLQKLNQRLQILSDPRIKRDVYQKVLLRLPIKRGSVVFESHLGQSFSDNPKYIYQALQKTGHKGKLVWSYADTTAGFPADATLVRRDSWGYLRALARAQYWVDNQGFPPALPKRSGTTYLQTWHGTALKTMGSDNPQIRAMLQDERKRLSKSVNRFDYFLVRSEYDVRTLVESFGMRAEPLRIGYPRNDSLLAADREERGRELRARFGFPENRKVVLYAPTYRCADAVFVPGFDLERFADEFGDTHLLLVRAHYLNTVTVPARARHAVLDLSAHPDVTELILASDALITDYSSVIFDYALYDRPMLFFAPDTAAYGEDRGTYFDLAERAPGPWTGDQDALFEALRELPAPGDPADPYRERRRQFAGEFGQYETGAAGERLLGQFFAGSQKGK